jgi:hypothetical protein
MPLLLPIEENDTYDTARQKINLGLDKVNDIDNNIVTNDAITLVNPVNNDDTLLYVTSAGVFKNFSFTTKVQDYLTAQNIKSVSDAERFYYSNLQGIY